MQELLIRLQLIFTQLADQVRSALANAETGQAVGAVIDIVLPVACGVLRVVAIIFAIIVIARCLLSLFR